MLASQLGILPALNGTIPCEGAKVIPYNADFSLDTEFDFDFTPQMQGGQVSCIQCVYVDNTNNGSNLLLTVQGTGQTILIAPNTAGFYTLLTPTGPAKINAQSFGAVLVYFAFMNFYIPPIVWFATP